MSVNSQETASAYLTALVYFNTFLYEQQETADSIIAKMLKPKADVYVLLQDFISYLANIKIASSSKRMFIRAVRSYLGFHNIDIIPSKFKNRVKMFKVPREQGEALDIETIRILLNACNNRRLKSFLLCLSSGGFRVRELAAVRHKDIDFSKSPTRVNVRAEYTKMRVSRTVYISDEATKHLKLWIAWRHREDRYAGPIKYDSNRLVYSVGNDDAINVSDLYRALNIEWHKVLKSCGLNQMRDGMIRHTITLHAFRSFVKSQLADHVNSDYSEWVLGHSASSYYRRSESERRKLYEKAMPYLTFLDFDAALDISQKDIKEQLREQQLSNITQKQQIQELTSKIDKVSKSYDAFLEVFEPTDNDDDVLAYRKKIVDALNTGKLKSVGREEVESDMPFLGGAKIEFVDKNGKVHTFDRKYVANI